MRLEARGAQVLAPRNKSSRLARNARGQGDLLRIALLDAAEALLDEVGVVDGLSLRRVTGRAGVTPNALYLHFSDLDALIVALQTRSFAQLSAVLTTAEGEHDGDPRRQLLAMSEAYCEFARRRPAIYRLLFGTYVGGARIVPREAAERAAADDDVGVGTFNRLVEAVSRCLGTGHDPFAPAVEVWCLLHGYASLQPVMPAFPFPPRERFLGEAIGALLRGA